MRSVCARLALVRKTHAQRCSCSVVDVQDWRHRDVGLVRTCPVTLPSGPKRQRAGTVVECCVHQPSSAPHEAQSFGGEGRGSSSSWCLLQQLTMRKVCTLLESTALGGVEYHHSSQALALPHSAISTAGPTPLTSERQNPAPPASSIRCCHAQQRPMHRSVSYDHLISSETPSTHRGLGIGAARYINGESHSERTYALRIKLPVVVGPSAVPGVHKHPCGRIATIAVDAHLIEPPDPCATTNSHKPVAFVKFQCKHR